MNAHNAPIHVTGAGVVGCFMMEYLDQNGFHFTWSDADTAVVAWKACTGSVCPEKTDKPGVMEAWQRYMEEITNEHVEQANYYKWDDEHGWMKAGVSWHVNVPAFVRATRVRYTARRRQEADLNQIEIQTVGHLRCKSWWWGWSWTADIPNLERACWSMRCTRQVRYIYPKPRTNHFYIGSTILHQNKPKNLDVETHLDWWKRNWQANTRMPDITFIDMPVEGWRPVGNPGAWSRSDEKTIVIEPMSASGVKFSPFVAEQIVRSLLP